MSKIVIRDELLKKQIEEYRKKLKVEDKEIERLLNIIKLKDFTNKLLELKGGINNG